MRRNIPGQSRSNLKGALGRAHPCLILIGIHFGAQHELAVIGDLLSLYTTVHCFILSSLYFWSNSSLQWIPWLCKHSFIFLAQYYIKLSLSFGHFWDKHQWSEDVESWNSHLFSYRVKIQISGNESRNSLVGQNALCVCVLVKTKQNKKERLSKTEHRHETLVSCEKHSKFFQEIMVCAPASQKQGVKIPNTPCFISLHQKRVIYRFTQKSIHKIYWEKTTRKQIPIHLQFLIFLIEQRTQHTSHRRKSLLFNTQIHVSSNNISKLSVLQEIQTRPLVLGELQQYLIKMSDFFPPFLFFCFVTSFVIESLAFTDFKGLGGGWMETQYQPLTLQSSFQKAVFESPFASRPQ